MYNTIFILNLTISIIDDRYIIIEMHYYASLIQKCVIKGKKHL